MHRSRFIVAFIMLIALVAAAAAQPQQDPFAGSITRDNFLSVEQAFEFGAEQLENGATRLRWQIAPGYYLYSHRLSFDGVPRTELPALPAGEPHTDDYFGDTEIYRHFLEIELPPGVEGPITVGWQGCADAGLCYPPQSETIILGDVAEPDVVAAAQAATAASSGPPDAAEDQSLAQHLQQQAFMLSLLAFLGLGLLLAFTPCSLPMLPILASVVVGSGATPRRGLLLALSYTVSMALIYAALGAAAATAGGSLQSWLQQPWLLTTFAALFVVLALAMFGLFELQLPMRARDLLQRLSQKQRGGTLSGAAILGALSGLLVGPCMTAPLAGALLYIAQSGDLFKGGLALFMLGMGMGLPLVLLVTAGHHLLPKPGIWMDRIKVAFGFLMLGTAITVVRPVVAETLWLGLWGVLLVSIAMALHELSAQLQSSRTLMRAIGAIGALWGAALLIGAAAGSKDPWRPLAVYAAAEVEHAQQATEFETFSTPDIMTRELALAATANEWVLIDYYADWCVTCKIMEREVFADSRVIAALDGVRLLRPDVTQPGMASRKLLGQFDVAGPPTLIWIGPDGSERRAARLVGTVTADQFINHWQKLRERG